MKRNRYQLVGEMTALLDRCKAEGRDHFTAEEKRAFDAAAEELDQIDPPGPLPRPAPPGGRAKIDPNIWAAVTGNAPPAARTDPNQLILRNDQKLADRVPREQRGEGKPEIGRWLRGVMTGRWDGAEQERAMAEGTGSAGGFLVPTPLSETVLDLARAATRVLQAGGQTVPMESQTLRIAKVLTDPTAQWHAEGQTINPSDITLTSVLLTARTITALCKFSRELFEDATNLNAVVSNSLAQSLALEIDRAALFGSGVAPIPRGVANFAGLSTVSMGVNGAPLTTYNEYITAVANIMGANFSPTGIILAPRVQADTARLKDTTNQPLTPPALVGDIPRYVTNQCATNLAQGTANNASTIFLADWSQLLVGMRTEIGIDILKEAYHATGEYACLAWARCDIMPAQLGAFSAIVGVTPTP